MTTPTHIFLLLLMCCITCTSQVYAQSPPAPAQPDDIVQPELDSSTPERPNEIAPPLIDGDSTEIKRPSFREELRNSFAAVGTEKPSSMARVSLIALQTIHGGAIGMELALAVDNEEKFVPAFIAGALSGGAASALLTSFDHVYPGQNAALTSGALWGAIHAGSKLNISERWLNLTEQQIALRILSYHVGGMVIGGTVHHFTKLTAGDVALINSVSGWTAIFLALNASEAKDWDTQDKILLATPHIAEAAMVGTFLYTRYKPMSRARILSINIVAGLSAIAGGLVYEDLNLRLDTGIISTLAFTAIVTAGFGAGAWLTRDLDESNTSVSQALNNGTLSFAPAMDPVQGLQRGGRVTYGLTF